MNIHFSSEYSSSTEVEFLSSTDPSETRLLEREVETRTHPALLAPIPGSEGNSAKFKISGVRPQATPSKKFSPNLMTFS